MIDLQTNTVSALQRDNSKFGAASKCFNWWFFLELSISKEEFDFKCILYQELPSKGILLICVVFGWSMNLFVVL